MDYFDLYLMHAQGKENYPFFKACRAYETAFELKKEGKVKHVGSSFHDRAEVLEEILTDYPEIEVVQIQFNYLDYEDPAVQSRACYEVCRKFNKPVIVMEPVKGGSLVNLPEDAKAVLDELHGGSPASYAIRFAAGFPSMIMVLSGMSNLEQMKDNLSYMKDFQPLKENELEAIKLLPVSLDDYDVSAVGTPTWWYTIAPAVLTFLHSQNWNGKIVVPFMTNGGWPGHVIKDMKKACTGAETACEMEVQFDSNGGDHLGRQSRLKLTPGLKM